MKFKRILDPLKRIGQQYDNITSDIASYLFGKTLGKSVIPGQNKNSIVYEEMLEKYTDFLAKSHIEFPTYEISENIFPISNKNSLQTFSIKHKGHENPKYLIYFPGNDEFIEGRSNSLMKMAETLNVNVITFNYRGKGKSSGIPKCSNDIIDDSKSYIDSIINDGVKPENILFYGKCFGGAIASVVACKYHEENKEVSLFNDRSFKDISSLCTGLLIDNLLEGKKNPFVKGFNTLFVKCAAPFVKYSLRKTRWEINAYEAYSEIPEKNKTYTVVKESKAIKMKKPMFDDGLISNESSLHFALKKARREYKMEILSSDLTPEEKEERLLELKERKLHGIENENRESYADLRRKQKLIHKLKKIDSVLPQIAEFKKELMSANRDDPNFENRKNEIIEELKQLSGKFLREDFSTYKIKDLDDFLDRAIIHLKKNIDKIFKLLYPKMVLAPIDTLEIRNYDDGEGKIPHNKALDSLNSRVEGKTGQDLLRDFIEKMEERNSSYFWNKYRCKIEILKDDEIEVFIKNFLGPKEMDEKKTCKFMNLTESKINFGPKGDIEVSI